MRARLFKALLECHSAEPARQMPSAEDISRQAQVSRATFYAHFESVQKATEALGSDLLDQMIASLATLFDQDGPLDRIVIGLSLFLMRTVSDPEWGHFVAHVITIEPDTGFYSAVRRDISSAAEKGEIDTKEIDAAVTLALGTMFEAIRYMQRSGDHRREYIEIVTAMTLRGLGVDKERTVGLIRRKLAQIRRLAPNHIDWWRDPWT